MKYLLIALLSLSAQAKEPIFYKGQRVTYKTSWFLHKACSGRGIISAYSESSSTYEIETPISESDCPSIVDKVPERDIKAGR